MTGPGRLARDQSHWMEPASMQATGVADMSAGPRPVHGHRPTSSSSTPSSTHTEDAAPLSAPPVVNLHVHSQEETSRSDPPSCSSAPGPCQPHGPVVSTSMRPLDSRLASIGSAAKKARWMVPQAGYLQNRHL